MVGRKCQGRAGTTRRLYEHVRWRAEVARDKAEDAIKNYDLAGQDDKVVYCRAADAA